MAFSFHTVPSDIGDLVQGASEMRGKELWKPQGYWCRTCFHSNRDFGCNLFVDTKPIDELTRQWHSKYIITQQEYKWTRCFGVMNVALSGPKYL